MKRFFLYICLMLLVGLSLQAQSIDQILTPTDDTYTYSDNSIRGMEDLLKTYHSTAGAQYRRITFLKFDISSLSPFVQSVKLRLYTNGFSAGGDNTHQFDLYPVTINTWSEDDITFQNFTEKAGADVTSPLLASYVVPAGQALGAQYIEFSGANLTKYITDSVAAGKQYISIRMREKYVVKNGANAVIVEFHSKEHSSGNSPELVVTAKDIEGLKAADIQVDGVSLANFDENTFRYVCKLPYETVDIPVVSALAKYPATTTLDVVQANGITGTEANRTAKINIQEGANKLSYSVVFEKLPPPDDARLSEIKIDGKPLEFFDLDKTDYVVYLPYTALDVPEITVEPNEPHAVTEIVNAQSIAASDTEEMRSSLLQVTSGDGTVHKTYKIIFQQLPELDLFLAIGQSNMAGRADYTGYTAPLNDVYLLTPGGELEIASNPLNKYSNIRKDISLQKLGPSYNFALKIQEHTGNPVAFVVNAQGGSAMTNWYQPGKSNYDASISRAKEAQKFGRYKAVIWHQGESDSSNPGTYMDRLKTLVQSLRNDLNEPDLYFVAGELAYWRGGGTGSTAFNNIIHTIADNITHSDWISAEGCTPLIDTSDPHFDTPSALLLGERYAEKIIQKVYGGISGVDTGKKNDFISVQTVSGAIYIQNKDVPAQFKISDLSGRLLRYGNLQAGQSVKIAVNQGVYVLSFHVNQTNQTRKIIIH